MIVFDLIKPGTWTNCSEIDALLRNLEKEFYKANISLNLFNKSNAENNPLEVIQNRISEIKNGSETIIFDETIDYSKIGDIILEKEINSKKKKWENGVAPDEFRHMEKFIHAESFLFAFDLFGQFLRLIKGSKKSPKIDSVYKDFQETFPDIRDIRNSAHHVEDRVRGKAKIKNKEVNIKPLDGALFIGTFFDLAYNFTKADGSLGQIEISKESMLKLKKIVENLYECFEWTGQKQLLPN
jgi:hypothetical protein